MSERARRPRRQSAVCCPLYARRLLPPPRPPPPLRASTMVARASRPSARSWAERGRPAFARPSRKLRKGRVFFTSSEDARKEAKRTQHAGRHDRAAAREVGSPCDDHRALPGVCRGSPRLQQLLRAVHRPVDFVFLRMLFFFLFCLFVSLAGSSCCSCRGGRVERVWCGGVCRRRRGRFWLFGRRRRPTPRPVSKRDTRSGPAVPSAALNLKTPPQTHPSSSLLAVVVTMQGGRTHHRRPLAAAAAAAAVLDCFVRARARGGGGGGKNERQSSPPPANSGVQKPFACSSGTHRDSLLSTQSAF
jgi:hypothetical protein